MRGMEGPLEILIAGVVIGGVFGGCAGYRVAGGIDGDDSPMDAYDEACVQEYADANDGDPETEVETAILEQPDCMDYITAMRAERTQAQMEEMQQP